MNEAPSNQTGLNDTFSSQPSPQTNPFTADLKGEFTSNFGTNTNAVSQIFKEGGFVGQNRTKYLMIAGGVIVVLALIFFLVSGGDDSDMDEFAGTDSGADEFADEGADDSDDQASAEDSDDGYYDEGDATADYAEPTAPVTASVPSYGTGSMGSSFSGGSGAVTLMEPADGSSLVYDESQGAATFSWSGGSGYIVFSRNASMNPVVMKVPVSGNSYSFHHPWPGTWYWKVQNRSGSTEVRSFNVMAPARRNVQLTQPAGGGSIAGNGGVVTWQGDSKVAYYRVEFSTGDWANPPYRFSSSGNSVSLNGVPAGQYMMRVGAFSEVSGRWEYTSPVGIMVQ